MRRYPRQQLHANFVRALRGHSVGTLAALAGFNSYTNLSPFLNRRPVPMTPPQIERLCKLAAVIGYAGPIFKEAR